MFPLLLAALAVAPTQPLDVVLVRLIQKKEPAATSDLLPKRPERVRVVREGKAIRFDIDLERRRRIDENWWIEGGRIERMRDSEDGDLVEESFEAGAWVRRPVNLARLASMVGRRWSMADALVALDDVVQQRRFEFVPLLLRELKVVSPTAFDDEVWHVVACLQMLRALADADIGTSDVFFTKQMSNGRLWIAPRDEQERAIELWRIWGARPVSGFALPPCPECWIY